MFFAPLPFSLCFFEVVNGLFRAKFEAVGVVRGGGLSHLLGCRRDKGTKNAIRCTFL